jgi:beta-lactamase class D
MIIFIPSTIDLKDVVIIKLILMKKCAVVIILFISIQLSGQVNLAKPFSDCGVDGSTTIYDYKEKKWIFSNKENSEVATLPASTFKILNSLILLETGVVKDELEMINCGRSSSPAKSLCWQSDR